ncbi:MAG: hypothetical protein JO093_18200 [Acidobacteria bacterium]|nr:hypothetical protein [Acidobacteriota bacterium]MBV9071298.1 hypothetical protein [Acidobacteriota bacterium]MBV9187554.1 hypothetical protein [Acidobacteriota bacterium]
MNLMIHSAEINPMYYGTLGFLMFSAMLASIGFWAIRGLKKDKRKREIGFTSSAPESRSRSVE